MESYLQFFDKPSHENAVIVHKMCGMTQDKTAKIINIRARSYKSWLTTAESYKAEPSLHVWNMFILELEARRLGFNHILDLMQQIQNQ